MSTRNKASRVEKSAAGLKARIESLMHCNCVLEGEQDIGEDDEGAKYLEWHIHIRFPEGHALLLDDYLDDLPDDELLDLGRALRATDEDLPRYVADPEGFDDDRPIEKLREAIAEVHRLAAAWFEVTGETSLTIEALNRRLAAAVPAQEMSMP